MTRWPELDYAAWAPTCDTLHMWCQIVGKYRLAHTPWVNHSWHATLYPTPRGLTTGPVPDGALSAEVQFDVFDHRLKVMTSDGKEAGFGLSAMSVAAFHERFRETLRTLGLTDTFDGRPNEVADAIPFVAQTSPGAYDGAAVQRFVRALLTISEVFETFRTGYLGKVSPVHLFWGSFDLAVTRFSGATAPLHPGGFPNLPDDVTREAYSHAVSSAGFWPGNGGGPIQEACFYSYASPSPEGFASAKVAPAAARFDERLSEFVVTYDAIRASATPDEDLLQFLETTYSAAADLGGWDRAALDCPRGKPRVVRPITA
ncbi:MAG: DUF5996 family protein [Pseudomonadota bacterium]